MKPSASMTVIAPHAASTDDTPILRLCSSRQRATIARGAHVGLHFPAPMQLGFPVSHACRPVSRVVALHRDLVPLNASTASGFHHVAAALLICSSLPWRPCAQPLLAHFCWSLQTVRLYSSIITMDVVGCS